MGEVSTFINGRAYKQDELLLKGKYKVLRVGNFYTNNSWYYSNLELGEKYYANDGDLLYTWSATFGPHIYHGDKIIYHYHIWKVELSEMLDKQFTLQLLEYDKEKITNDKNGSTMVHITKKGMEEKQVTIPFVDEQKHIGNYFKQLDETIALHQQKIDKLKQLKKGYLQVMFPQKGEDVPRLRFANFNASWKRTKLKDLVERVVRKNRNLESTLPLTISAQHGLIDQNTFFKKQVASRDMSNYYLLKNGEFAYNKSYSIDYPLGAVKRLDKYEQGVLSTLYIVFKPTKVDSDFLVSYYGTNDWHKEVSKRAAEGARNHGLLNISAEDFFGTELKVPTEKNEQKQVGDFFKQFNDTITIHQTKIKKLQSLKKAFLQKMFL